MTNKSLTLFTLLLATGTATSVANAGGVRLSMAGPLGAFTAHPHLSSGPGGTARYSTRQIFAKANPHCDKPGYAKPSYVGRIHHSDVALLRKARHSTAKAETAEASEPRKLRRLPKLDVANETTSEVKTAKLEDNTTVTDTAPAIFVPDSPPAPTAEFTGTQSTPSTARTAAVTPASDATPATAPATTTNSETVPTTSEPPKTESKAAEVKSTPAAPAVVETKSAKASDMAKKICKRFSAAVAGLIDVPCGD